MISYQTTTLLSEILSFLVRTDASKDQQDMAPNTRRRFFSICHVVQTYTHNSKTKGHVRTLYLRNDCSIIRDIYFLGWSYMQDTISKLWIQARIASSFQYDIL